MPTIKEKIRNLAHGAVADIKSRSSIDITVDEFLKMVDDEGEQAYFAVEVDYPGAYTEPADGLDTCVRDVVLNIFAHATIEMEWPCLGDPAEVREEFTTKLAQWAVDNEKPVDK